jgi:hypothetical protein
MRYVLLTLATVCTVYTDIEAIAADRSVEFEVLIDSETPLGAGQDWLEVLKQLKVSQVRVRSRNASDNAPDIRGAESGSKRVQVTAVLTSDNRLAVPKTRFRRSDQARLSDWIARLRVDPEDLPEAKKSASPAQLIQLRRQLSAPIADPTHGKTISEFVKNAQQEWEVPITVDRSARVQLDSKINVELSGLTRGTALAIAVRGAGGVITPNPDGKSLTVTREGQAEQSWPIGWRSEQPLPNLVPKLSDSLNVEVKDTPLLDVLNAIQKKVGIPFVIDQSEMQRNDIDMESIKVSIRPQKVMYKKILDGILTRNFLSGEVRVDEAGTPFYWITSLKRDRR